MDIASGWSYLKGESMGIFSNFGHRKIDADEQAAQEKAEKVSEEYANKTKEWRDSLKVDVNSDREMIEKETENRKVENNSDNNSDDMDSNIERERTSKESKDDDYIR